MAARPHIFQQGDEVVEEEQVQSQEEKVGLEHGAGEQGPQLGDRIALVGVHYEHLGGLEGECVVDWRVLGP